MGLLHLNHIFFKWGAPCMHVLVWSGLGNVMKTKVVWKWSGDLDWQVWHKYLYALSIPSLFFLFTRTSSAGRHTLVFLLQTCFLVCAYSPPSLVVVSTFVMTHHQGKRAVKSNPAFFYLTTTIPSPF